MVVALALRPALQGAVAPLFLAAVVLACWYGGLRPGLVATVLSLVITEAVFFPPFLVLGTAAIVRASAFAVVALLTASLYTRARDARERAEALARAREDLVRQEQAARADAETAGRSKDEFLTTLSHELRTPLNALMGWIWWLRRGDLDEERQERALETIERSTTSLAQLVEDLLDVSRIITGKLRISARAVEPAAAAAAAVDAVRPAAAAKSIALGVTVDAAVGTVLAHATAGVAAPVIPPRAQGPRLDDLRILVVEDDADARLWLKDSLEHLGAVVLMATSVQEAVETFERDTPHVLVSDIRLPDADGYALHQRARAADARRGRHTPAIALTAYPRVEDRARALEAGFQMHVPKPVAPDDLTAAIASLAGRGGGLS